MRTALRSMVAMACAGLMGFVLSASAEDVITSVDKAGKSHSTKGYKPMKAAPDAKKFAASEKIKTAKLPPKVDLRKHMTAVENQGDTSSCVANAMAGSFEYWIKRANNEDFDVSRLFLYYNARWRAGDPDKDEGSVIQLAMEGLKDFGACSEKTWPFEKDILFDKPSREAYQQASETKIKDMQQVPLELQAWKEALASGLPVVFGCLLFESFDQCNKNGGVVPMPSPADISRSSHGGHAMCAVGYCDKEEVFIVRNSWGDQWGDNGYCYMPYNYLINDKFNGGDCWVFIPEKPIENPEDDWYEDDQPVTDDGRGVTFVTNPYKEEDYETVTITWWEEEVEEYVEEEPAEYKEYVEYSETEEWEQMEEGEHDFTEDGDEVAVEEDDETRSDEEVEEEAEDEKDDEAIEEDEAESDEEIEEEGEAEDDDEAIEEDEAESDEEADDEESIEEGEEEAEDEGESEEEVEEEAEDDEDDEAIEEDEAESDEEIEEEAEVEDDDEAIEEDEADEEGSIEEGGEEAEEEGGSEAESDAGGQDDGGGDDGGGGAEE